MQAIPGLEDADENLARDVAKIGWLAWQAGITDIPDARLVKMFAYCAETLARDQVNTPA